MQIAFVVFAGYLLAVSPPARHVLDLIASAPRTPRQAVGLAAFASMAICWLNWGVGLVASALLIRAIGARNTGADYRLLVAAGYLGMGTTWHGGPSGTVPLLFASKDSFMVRDGLIHDAVALADTIFAPGNLALMILVTFALTVLAMALQPATVAPSSRNEAANAAPPPSTAWSSVPTPRSTDADILRGPAARISRSRFPTAFLGLLGLGFVGFEWAAGRFALSLDGVNLIVLSLSLLAYRSAVELQGAVEDAARPLHGVVLQFPLYAGIYGLIRDTALAQKLATAFLSVASESTLPIIVFVYSGVLNYWVPSGGAKWAMEAPYLLHAASALDVPPAAVAMAYAYGDMATNLIQPFWAIPLLGVAKLEFKDILGFELIFLAAFSALATLTLLF
jgi:short-chain fatty acids transporter